jgi:hypothetical protein
MYKNKIFWSELLHEIKVFIRKSNDLKSIQIICDSEIIIINTQKNLKSWKEEK